MEKSDLIKILFKYIPYNLNVKINDEVIVLDNFFFDLKEEILINYNIKDLTSFVPILRPMEDLIKVVNNEVPLIKIAQLFELDHYDQPRIIYNKKSLSPWEVHLIEGCTGIYEVVKHDIIEIAVTFFAENNTIAIEEGGELLILDNPLIYYDYLFANHFDLYGLIKKGLAIDINKINIKNENKNEKNL